MLGFTRGNKIDFDNWFQSWILLFTSVIEILTFNCLTTDWFERLFFKDVEIVELHDDHEIDMMYEDHLMCENDYAEDRFDDLGRPF